MRSPGCAPTKRHRAGNGRHQSPKSRAFAVHACAIMAAAGPPAVLVPSLINPPRILDLDEEVSLTAAIARMGRRSLLLDWGEADAARRTRRRRTHRGHCCCLCCAALASPLRWSAIASAERWRSPRRTSSMCERVVTLAAPWHFAHYPRSIAEPRCRTCGATRKAASRELGALPMEVLQASFWSLDPERTVRKFAEFGQARSRRAPRRAASSSSRIGRTKASPCPTRLRAS